VLSKPQPKPGPIVLAQCKPGTSHYVCGYVVWLLHKVRPQDPQELDHQLPKYIPGEVRTRGVQQNSTRSCIWGLRPDWWIIEYSPP